MRKTSPVFWMLLLCLVQVGAAETKPRPAQTPAAPGNPWVGVWKVNLEGQNKDFAFFAASETSGKFSVQYYNRLWEQQKVQSATVENGKLTIESRPTARAYRLELKLTGPDKAEGSWLIVHPQVKVTGPMRAARVLSVNKWDALEGFRALEQPNHIVDLNKFLIEKAPTGSLPEFVRFWRSEVEPRFLFVLSDILYGKEATTEADRSVLLKPVYQLIKSKEYRQLAADAAKQMAAAIEEIKLKQKDFYRENPVVLMPSIGGLDGSAGYYNRLVILRLPVDQAAKDHPGKALPAFLAEQQLKFVMYHFFPPVDQRLGVEMIREGLAGYLAVSKGLVPGPDVLFNLPAGTYKGNVGKLDDVRRKLLANLEVSDPRQVKSLLSAGSPEGKRALMAAYRFGEMVGSRYDMNQLSSMGARQLIELLKEYLKGS